MGAYRRRFRGGEDAWREIDFGWGKRGHFACFWKGRSIAHESLGLLPFMKEAVKALKLSDAERDRLRGFASFDENEKLERR